MRRYVIAYPELEQADFERIQNVRKPYDRMHPIIAPHFTFVFAVEDFSEEDFTLEIKKQLNVTESISFSLRCCTINKDTFSENFFACLVPDEGFSKIVKLHDKLYRDKLFHHHRLDIDYIPHIEIANSEDKMFIKNMVDDWNENDFVIHGKISSLEIISYEDRVVHCVEKIKFSELIHTTTCN